MKVEIFSIAISTFNSSSKFTHAEREYRLPFTANIDRLKSGISIAPLAQISSAQRAHISTYLIFAAYSANERNKTL